MEEGGIGEERVSEIGKRRMDGWGNSRWWSTVRTYLLISPPFSSFLCAEGEINQLRRGMGFVGLVLSTAMWELFERNK